jgi:hypothetical protein
LGALLLAFTPAIALACHEDSKTTCKVKVNTVVSTNTKCTFQFNFNTGAAPKPSWTPGHLIEHDSMKVDPSEEPEIKNAEWVTISYANGAIQSIKKGERSKKSRTAARPTGAAGPTVQSAPNPY